MRIQDVLDELGIEYRTEGHEHCRPGWLQLDCPRCSPNWKHFRLGYNLRFGYTNCWGCGPMNLVTSLSELSGETAGRVVSLLQDLIKEGVQDRKEVRGKLELPAGLGPLWPAHAKYLKDRGFVTADLVRLWKVQGLAADAGKLAWRVFIPIHYKGELVSWTTRSISDAHKVRYRSAEARQEKIDHKTLLYGQDYVRHAVIVCEGPLDVWKVGPGAVCTFGVGYKREQMVKLIDYPVRVVCFDSEPDGQRKARKLCSELEVYPGRTYNVVLESAKDPGGASPEELDQLRRRFLTG
jgi:hypothetical protein